MDIMKEIFDQIKNLGWDFDFRYDAKTKLYQMIIGRPEWATDNLYASVACPSWKNENYYVILVQALRYCEG
jgi:hypothetical protein